MNHFDEQNNFLNVTAVNGKTEDVVKSINKYIDRHECKKMCIDISTFNIIDAAKISAICSAKHFSKYPFGSLQWVVNNKETRSIMKPFLPLTAQTTIKHAIIPNYAFS